MLSPCVSPDNVVLPISCIRIFFAYFTYFAVLISPYLHPFRVFRIDSVVHLHFVLVCNGSAILSKCVPVFGFAGQIMFVMRRIRNSFFSRPELFSNERVFDSESDLISPEKNPTPDERRFQSCQRKKTIKKTRKRARKKGRSSFHCAKITTKERPVEGALFGLKRLCTHIQLNMTGYEENRSSDLRKEKSRISSAKKSKIFSIDVAKIFLVIASEIFQLVATR